MGPIRHAENTYQAIFFTEDIGTLGCMCTQAHDDAYIVTQCWLDT